MGLVGDTPGLEGRVPVGSAGIRVPPASASDVIDQLPLSRRYGLVLVLLTLITVFDYFDLSVIGFLGAIIAKQNHFNYGQLSVVIISAGVGTIVGALVAGELSDQFGRRPILVIGTAICGFSSLGLLAVPTGDWITLAVLRFFVGVGIATAAGPAMTLAVEYTPRQRRFLLSSLPVIGATGGALVATTTVAVLIETLGWRGVCALGVVPAVLGLVFLFLAPESAPWLAARGRYQEARNAIARMQGIAASKVAVPAASRFGDSERVPFTALFGEPRRPWLTILLWGGTLTANSGVYLWGPTLVAFALGASTAATARIFTLIAVAGILGKIAFSLLSRFIGRRRTNEIGCFGGSIALCAAGVLHQEMVVGVPVLVVLLVLGAFFFDGVVANLAPYTVEIYPTRLAARGYSLGQAANGVAKLFAPLALAVLAGVGLEVTASTTAASLVPSFIFMGGCVLLSGVSSLLIPIDPLER